MESIKVSATQSLGSSVKESVNASAKVSVKNSIEATVKKGVTAPVMDLGKTTVKKETPRQHQPSKVQKPLPNPISDMKPNFENKLTSDKRNEESVNEGSSPHHLLDTIHRSSLGAASQVDFGDCKKGTIDNSTLPGSQASLSDDLTGSVACIGSNLCAEHFTTLSAMFLHLESGACCSGIDRHALSNVILSGAHGNANSGMNDQQFSLDPLQNRSSLTGSLIGVQTDNQDIDSSGCCTPPSPNQPSSPPDNLPPLYGGTKCILHDYTLENHNSCPHCQMTFDTSHTLEQDLI